MKIKGLHIHGFGKLRDQVIDDLSSGIILFQGENEAGKSTIMSFIRYMLFGSASLRAQDNRYEPSDGGPMGGTIVVEDDRGVRYRIERSGGTTKGKVEVTSLDGSAFTEATVEQLRGGLSETVFRDIFAFSLTELQQLKTLQNDEISSYLYGAGMGMGGVSIFDVERQLLQQKEQLFKPRGSNPTINVTLKKLDEIERQIKSVRDENGTYNALTQQLSALNAAVQNQEGEIKALEGQLLFLMKAEKCLELWSQAKKLRSELQDLTEIESFPDEGVTRLERYEKERLDLRAVITDTEQKAAVLREKAAEISLNAIEVELVIEKDKIEAFYLRLPTMREKQERLREFEIERLSIEDKITQLLQEMDPEWHEEDVVQLDTSVAEKELVRNYKDHLQRLQLDNSDATKELDRLALLLEEKQRELETIEESLVRERPNIDAVHKREQAIKSLEKMKQNSDQETMKRDFLQKQLSDLTLYSGGNATKSIPLVISAVIFVFITFVLTALSKPLYIAVSVAIAIALVSFLLTRRTASDRRILHSQKQIRNEIAACDNQLQQLQYEIDKLMRTVGISNVSEETIEELVYAVEQEKRSFEVWNRLNNKAEENRAALDKERMKYEKSKQRKQAAQSDLSRMSEAWNKELQRLSIRRSLSPDGVLDLFHYGEQAKELIRRKSKNEQTAAEIRKELTEYINETVHLCGNFDLPLEAEYWQQGVERLKLLLGDCVSRTNETYRLQEKEGEYRQFANEHHTRLMLVDEAINKLLTEGQAQDEEHFRVRFRMFEDYQSAKKRLKEISREMELIAGSEDEWNKLEVYLQQGIVPNEIYEEQSSVGERLNQLKHEVDQNKRAAGKLEQKIEEIASRGDIADLLQKKEEYVTELKQGVKKWSTYAICEFLCRKARETYEKERQPNVVRTASDYFTTITEGKYSQVLAGMEERKLYAVMPNGIRLEPHLLSRGTAEQLYVSMRFALIREYSRLTSLPVIMDDVFVNFDKTRLRQAIKALKDVSGHHQILFFTCHPHVSDIMQEELHDMQQINLANKKALLV